MDGRFTYFNPKAIHVSGYSAEELQNMTFMELVSNKYKKKLTNFYRWQLEEKMQSTYIEFEMITKSGDTLWLGQSVDLDISEDGKVEFISLARDITDRKRAERALIMNEDKFRSIIENMELGLLEVNREGYIIKAYPKFCALTGFNPDELEGKKADDILLDSDSAKLMRLKHNERNEGRADVYETQIKRKDGSKVWVLISGAPYYNINGQVAGSVGIHLDITDQKRTQKELEEARDVAEQSLKDRESFLATISHEIRTPMNAIIGLSEILDKSYDNYERQQKKHLSTIRSSAEHLLMLINDLLDYSKIKAGKLSLNTRPAELYSHIGHVIDLLDNKAESKNLLLEFNSNIPENAIYDCDPLRIEEILINLTGNAIKFTQEGQVELKAFISKETNTHTTIKFEVKDTGVGIPATEIDHIFQDFGQSSNTQSSNNQGTGLGLPITKSLIELMDSELSVESEINKGTTFSFELTLEKIKSSEKIENRTSVEEKKEFPGLKILVVEDNEINFMLADTILTNWKCNVSHAQNGLEAVNMVRENSFDIVLMDVRMPKMNGLEATKIIRGFGYENPIVALTANALESEIQKCYDSGMNDFMSKPYTQKELYEKLQKHVNIDNPMNTHKTYMDLGGIQAVTGGDISFANKMIDLFIEKSLDFKDKILILSEKEEINELNDLAHMLKSSIAHVATEELTQEVKEIESEEEIQSCKQKVSNFLPKFDRLISELKTYRDSQNGN